MDQTLFTPQLKLTLITTAERGSQELEWLHELRSDEKATWWSIYGRSKTIEDTEKTMKGALPTTTNDGEEKPYRAVYAVHELLAPNSNPASQEDIPTRMIGLITLRSVDKGSLPLPPRIFPDSVHSPDCLAVELGYQFLPAAWGKGFATQSVTKVLDACQREQKFWDNYQKVFVRAIVNGENPASRRVMVKCGMKELAVHVWDGDGIWLAGKWRTTDDLHIFGKFVRE
ncbi:hypothetical protein COCCADRAFT_86913 [Bipolaris zeicola 26-R-13]|uniref:N-acetyltransferase domain-containing protein n=1 Tax=Cochliobolus carbonum (strain 26-R-13) TaxID=930089 RepID=W6YHB1_COCC2|nr:uncharacterized protein COCCADRAFT_86913 [Bipolaris zeicola 26-R-13]EUC36905.1 hypothetical protein COCCADRAFT_86913 [Bipolaris zeicola 26-R-13]